MKLVFICYRKLHVFSKLHSSQKHECKECDWEIVESSKGEISIKKWTHMKIGVGSRCVEKKRSKRRVEKSRDYKSAEHLIANNKVVATFNIIFKMWKSQTV